MRKNWLAIILAGSVVIALSMGVRQAFGVFLRPVASDLGISFATFGMAVALQNVVWGLTQPLAGLLADRIGGRAIAFAGGLLYVAGLVVAAVAPNSTVLILGLGILVGLGQSGTAFAVILAVLGRAVPITWLTLALGLGSTASSIGIFVLMPSTVALLDLLDWRTVMLLLAALVGTIPLLALYLVDEPMAPAASGETSWRAALAAACSDRDFWLMNIGFAVCGFQLAFVITYLPETLIEGGLSSATGATVLAAIGLFNIGGTYLAGMAGGVFLKTRVLATIYLVRAGIILAFMALPLTAVSAIAFGVAMGFLWTATVPLTSGVVANLWGRRNLAFLFGLVYVGHQIGAFVGAWIGGVVHDRTGSFDMVWAGAVLASIAAAIMHLVLSESPRPIALAERVSEAHAEAH